MIHTSLIAGVVSFAIAGMLHAATNYVSLSGAHVPPFGDWSTAATTIQSAVDAALDGDTIMVSNGVYRLSSEILLAKTVTVKSLSGARDTIVDACYPTSTSRCFNVSWVDAIIDGFTVTRGYATGAVGGGILCDGAGIVRNCMIYSNRSSFKAGGVGCFYGGMLQNCYVTSNYGAYGGGIECYFAGRVESCTIVGNTADQGGGIQCAAGGVILNSIIYGNNALDSPNIGSVLGGGQFSFSCTPSLAPTNDAGGNFTNDPEFVNAAMGDFALNIISPCINAGTNIAWMTDAFDLAGSPRINTDRVDMGCYELGGDVRIYGPFVWKQRTRTSAQCKLVMPLLKPYFATNYLIGIKDRVTGIVLDGPHPMTPNKSLKTWKFKDKTTKVQVTYTQNTTKKGTKNSVKYTVPTILSTNSHLFLRKP